MLKYLGKLIILSVLQVKAFIIIVPTWQNWNRLGSFILHMGCQLVFTITV